MTEAQEAELIRAVTQLRDEAANGKNDEVNALFSWYDGLEVAYKRVLQIYHQTLLRK
jgi:hypothetical protein